MANPNDQPFPINPKPHEQVGDWRFMGNTTNPGNPLWNEWQNVKTGESTLKIYEPKKISQYDTCDHYYVPIDNNGHCQCQKCELGAYIVWGRQIIKEGKIVQLI